MGSLLNKHAVITGGSRGIGLAIAHRFASEGASITLVGRDQARLQSALKSLPPRSPEADWDHNFQSFDVSEMQGWSELVNKMKQSKQNIDILVNAAGITQDSLLFRGDHVENQRIINTNLMGTMFGCQVTSQRMIKKKTKGCIINISSLLAVKGGRGASAYAASKAGIVEVGQFGIRVNVLLPGYIQTDMTEYMNQKGGLSAQIPLGRFGTAEEVADAAAFLAKNPYAHNAVLNLDGGLSAT
ncbi:hypothetical protein BKA67DRAFT_663797 [Truncatella angustata]|uniref:Uncharacterized protein n=1 Tax=Truncatella angustata TaxID=152316 RepID=A0A9P8UC92_9PEZI|nr:uncharacterized protein BKA67DRAFT_663797 [Truncatella angustata]KAH6645920.1 hypothetical protein BKA67DRAFT_663797 [Truncatella angustata]